jgi:hypothetical protein
MPITPSVVRARHRGKANAKERRGRRWGVLKVKPGPIEYGAYDLLCKKPQNGSAMSTMAQTIKVVFSNLHYLYYQRENRPGLPARLLAIAAALAV